MFNVAARMRGPRALQRLTSTRLLSHLPTRPRNHDAGNSIPKSHKKHAERDAAPKTDAWYEYHISRGCSTRPDLPKPPDPLLALKPEVVEKDVPESLRKEPLRVFDTCPDAGDDLMSKCLELYISRVHARTQSLSQAREHYLRDRPGAWALYGLMRQGNHEQADFLAHTRLLRGIAHCLIAEKDIQSMQRWMQVAEPAATGSSLFSTNSERWKSQLLRAMVIAQVFWTTDSDFFAEPLTTIVERGNEFSAGKRLAMDWLTKQLIDRSDCCKDVTLYDRFGTNLASFYYHGGNTSSRAERSLASLRLAHPSRPDAGPFLRFLRNEENSEEKEEACKNMLRPRSIWEADALRRKLYYVVRVCMSNHQKSDALWILDLAQDHSQVTLNFVPREKLVATGIFKPLPERVFEPYKRKATL